MTTQTSEINSLENSKACLTCQVYFVGRRCPSSLEFLMDAILDAGAVGCTAEEVSRITARLPEVRGLAAACALGLEQGEPPIDFTSNNDFTALQISQ